jgi:pantoate--beta-alanine ligase
VTVVTTPAAMRDLSRSWLRAGETVALVPTMGALHEGHLALVRAAAAEARRVVVSIFVNPTQFGPAEDFGRYPRDLAGDLALLAPLSVDAIYAPTAADMYPAGFQTTVELARLPHHLCGLTRTNHFGGVALVVAKLFAAVQPDAAVFGLKDYQQVRVIERMTADLDLGVRIVRHPTVREPDGLALSSRNRYLSPTDRAVAPALNRVLRSLAERIAAGEADGAALAATGRAALAAAGFDVEYLNVCDPDTLDDVDRVSGPVLLAVAARLGATRLIDNLLAAPGPSPATP